MANEVVKKYYSERRAWLKLNFPDDYEFLELLDQEELCMQRVAEIDRRIAERLIGLLQKDPRRRGRIS